MIKSQLHPKCRNSKNSVRRIGVIVISLYLHRDNDYGIIVPAYYFYQMAYVYKNMIELAEKWQKFDDTDEWRNKELEALQKNVSRKIG